MNRHGKIFLKPIAAMAIAAIGIQFNAYPGDAEDRAVFLSEIPAYPGNVILGRPTENSVTTSVMMNSKAKAFIEYGTGGAFDRKTGPAELAPGEPMQIVIGDLKPDTAYNYRLTDSETGKQVLPADGSYSFHTARKSGASFTFAVQADSHLDGLCLPELYRATLANELSGSPDFLIDLGDTFMTGKIPDRRDALKQYLAQRYYFGLVGNSVPLFLVLGNHDGEEANRKDACEKDGLAVWACGMRKKYFPNPEPDGFYSGNIEKQTHAGQLQDYYSWNWGDALFVVLDPYWYSRATRGGKAQWGMTLGKTQYDWLASTLRNSHAKFKFIFIHQLVGGLDSAGRGGAEAVPFYEWGGHEKDGSDSFAANRPGWEKPIHDLLVETGVSVVFHGHDHFFAKQERDGIVYQLVPQAANRNLKRHQAKEYGYEKGDFLPNSGYLRVSVNPQQVKIEYIRSVMPDPGGKEIVNGQSALTYTIASSGR